MISRAQKKQLGAKFQRHREEMWPAEIEMPGTDGVIDCAGSQSTDQALLLVVGGGAQVLVVSFSVLRSRLTTRPILGTNFRWREKGETEWNDAAVRNVVNQSDGLTVLIRGGNPAQ